MARITRSSTVPSPTPASNTRSAGRRRCGRGDGGARFARALDDGGTRKRGPVGLHEAADAVERLGGDAAAVAQPRGELAVVDGAPAEGRLRKSAVPAIVGDFLQQVLRVHGLNASTFRSDLRVPRLGGGLGWAQEPAHSEPSAPRSVNHKRSHFTGGKANGKYPNDRIGRYSLCGAAVCGPHQTEICRIVGSIPQDGGRNPT